MKNTQKEYHKAIDCLCGMVQSGELAVGSKLPSERAIAEKLSIGRNSTREALRVLEIMGMIECKRGSGNYLCANMSSAISEIIDIMLLLGQTKTSEVSSFCRNMDKAVCFEIIEKGNFSESVQLLEKILNQSQSLLTDDRITCDKNFHTALIEATQNRLWITFSTALTAVYHRRIEIILKNADDGTQAQLCKAHNDIVSALKKGDREKCETAINLHYDIVDREFEKIECNKKFDI